MEEEKLHAFIEMAGLETEEEFYKKFPTEEAFFEAFPEAREQFDFGGFVQSYINGGVKNSDPLYMEAEKQYEAWRNNPGNIESPEQTLTSNSTAHAKAMKAVANNPWTNILDGLGSGAMAFGMSQAGNIVPAQKAYGGGVDNVPVEVEGNEVAELPQGGLVDFEGPSHEQGGIKANLPESTTIFSDRIKIDGITMANRKKKRDKLTKKIEKKFADDITDILAKNALERTKEVNEKENQFDLNLQEEVDGYMKGQEQSGEDPVQQFAVGTPSWGILPEDPNNKAANANFARTLLQNSRLPREDLLSGNMNLEVPNYNSKRASETNPNDRSGITDNRLKVKSTSNDSYSINNPFSNATFGDFIGVLGNLQSAVSPLNTTLENRAGDTPNINHFQNYGKEGLKTLEGAKGELVKNRDRAKQDLELSRSTLGRSNRNSARGVNTMRALDIAVDNAATSSNRQIENDFSTQLMQLLTQQATAETQRDNVVMGGEQNRANADMQDRDQFYSNLSENRVNLGEGIANTGKALNKIQRNKANESLLNNLSDYVSIGMANGTITPKQGVYLHGDSEEGFNVFEEKELWKDLGYETKEDWDKLSEKEKKILFSKALVENKIK